MPKAQRPAKGTKRKLADDDGSHPYGVSEKKRRMCMKKLNLPMELAFGPYITDWNENFRKIKAFKSASHLARHTMEDLPDFVLGDIFRNVNIWHHTSLRLLTKRMTQVHRDFLFGKLRELRHKGTENEKVVMNAIYVATFDFTYFGMYQTIFAGFLLGLFRDFYDRPVVPKLVNLEEFCYQFFKFCEETNQRHKLHSRHLVFLVTFLKIIKSLSTEPMVILYRRNIMYVRAVIAGADLSNFSREFWFHDVTHLYLLAKLVCSMVSPNTPSYSITSPVTGVSTESLYQQSEQKTTLLLKFRCDQYLHDFCVDCCTKENVDFPDPLPEPTLRLNLKIVNGEEPGIEN